MLNYCIDRLKLYSFQNSDVYEDKFKVYENEYILLKDGVIELLTTHARKNNMKRIQYLSQIQQLMTDLNEYDSKANTHNLEHLAFMISLIHYEVKYTEIKHLLSIIDINNNESIVYE